jgi:hypothetical protein
MPSLFPVLCDSVLCPVPDRVAVYRAPGGTTRDLPSSVLALDTFISCTDILVIHHAGAYPPR